MRNIASFLRTMRQRAGLTQYEASFRIVDKDTLSLYERGRQCPHPENFMLLMERYGITGYPYGDFFDQRTAELMNLKNKILTTMNSLELGDIPELLYLYKNECEKYNEVEVWENIFEWQFFSYVKAWYYYLETQNAQEFLGACMECIALTQPDFREKIELRKAYLIQNELMILNAIAIAYAKTGRECEALILFLQLLNRQYPGESSHPIKNRNIACLSHNAALLEWKMDPMLSQQHLEQSMNQLLHYGGMWTGCLVWRSQIQIRQKIDPSLDQTEERWELERAYRRFRPPFFCNTDFETFIEMEDYLFLL